MKIIFLKHRIVSIKAERMKNVLSEKKVKKVAVKKAPAEKVKKASAKKTPTEKVKTR